MSVRWLRPGEILAGAAGALLLVSLFLPWYSISVELAGAGRLHANISGWQALTVIDVLLAIAALCGIALLVAQATLRRPGIPVALSVIATTIGIVATLLVLFRLIDAPAPAGRAIGIWLALIGALGVGAGGWLSMGDERNRGVPEPPVEVRPAPPAA
jgi:uncharacterized membrane protein